MVHVRANACMQEAPEWWITVKAHGKAVGLPSDDDMGNSGERLLESQRLVSSLLQYQLMVSHHCPLFDTSIKGAMKSLYCLRGKTSHELN